MTVLRFADLIVSKSQRKAKVLIVYYRLYSLFLSALNNTKLSILNYVSLISMILPIKNYIC
jgi:hypothetical protein